MASPTGDTALDNDNDSNRQGLQRRESKKHKFRPFSAFRRLFSGGKSRRSKASISTPGDEENGKGKSAATAGRPTSAPVHSDSPDQERLAVQRQTSVGDNRMINDDSIISPVQKGKTSPFSDPNVPKSAFKAELASKLTKRRSYCSEEDEEDGLRQGVAPAALTTDVSGGEPAKDDLFNSQWTSVVIGTSSPSTDISPSSKETQGSLDLSEMARTELLKSDAAKDRISVKPRSRKTNWQSRKRREGRYSLSLPSLVEVDPGSSNSSSQSGPQPPPGGRPRSEYIDPSVLSDFDLNVIPSAVSAAELSDAGTKGSEAKENDVGAAAATSHPSTTTTTTTTTVTTLPSRSTLTSVLSDKQKPQSEKSAPDAGAPASQNSKTQRVSFATDKGLDSEKAPAAETVVEVVGAPSMVQAGIQKGETEPMAVNVTGSPVVVASGGTSISPALLVASSSSSSASVSTSSGGKKEGLRQTDGESENAFSPRPEYKIRRQQRSKTLPVQQSIVTVQRTASQRGERSASSHVTKNLGETPEQVSKAEEPEWVALARRRSQKRNEESQQSASSVDTMAPVRQSPKSGPYTTVNTTTITTTGTVTIPGSNVTTTTETPSITIMPSTAARQDSTHQSQTGAGWNPKGGSVVTLPQSTVTLLANRDTSVKVTPTRPQPGSSFISSSSTPLLSESTPAPSTTSAASVNLEPKTPQLTVTSEAHSWKSQSVKTPSAYVHNASSSSTAPRPTPSSSVSSLPRSYPRPVSSSTTKTDPRPLASSQASSPQRPYSQKSTTPAWRSEILQRTLDPGDVKIELIERSPSGGDSTGGGKMAVDSGSLQQSANKGASDTRDLPSDQCRTAAPTRRHSKVMDLMKNFENLQSVS